MSILLSEGWICHPPFKEKQTCLEVPHKEEERVVSNEIVPRCRSRPDQEGGRSSGSRTDLIHLDAFWIGFVTTRFSSEMPPKSAAVSSNMSVIPSYFRISVSWIVDSILNLGIINSTRLSLLFFSNIGKKSDSCKSFSKSSKPYLE